MRRLLLSAAATALLLTPLACDFGNQLLAERVMVGTLLSTPSFDVPAGAMPDGGLPGEPLTIPGQTAAFVFFGTRKGELGTPEPLANATVRLEVRNGSTLNLDSKGAGTYGLTSSDGDDGGVQYQSSATYRFVAVQGGNSHVGVVEDAPALERIEGLHPAEGFIRLTANQGLTLQRPAVPAGKERTLGFITVFPLGANGEKGALTYTNFPDVQKEPLKLLELVALPDSWKKQSLSIPGSAFPAPNTNYLVVFQTVKSGGPESDNLFIGSAFLVGTADIGLVQTQ